MLLRCPQCKTEFRLTALPRSERVIRYYCSGCERIVRLDLELDEVPSSSSSTSYRAIARRKTILVADDAPRMRQVAARLLEEAGFEVLVASDGAEALARIRAEHPDLVLLDLLMPGMNGFEVLREMQRDPRVRDTPVLVMSGIYKDDVVSWVRRMGALDFLEKATVVRDLVERSRRALDLDLQP